MTEAEASELVGDDIRYWMTNPFLDDDARVEKVVWWLNRIAARQVQVLREVEEDLTGHTLFGIADEVSRRCESR